MKVILDNISKRYVHDWILKDVSHTFDHNSVTGITGINGSGKSTLIKIISGWLSPSLGNITYSTDSTTIHRDQLYKKVSVVAPYTSLILEYDLQEMYEFHTQFQKLHQISDFQVFKDVLKMKSQKGKMLKYYSSGMLQRVQLALALYSETTLLLLDEPTSFLDDDNKKWYHSHLSQNTSGRTIIISSNEQSDFAECQSVISVSR